MKVIDDIISTLKDDSPVKEVRACMFWTAVCSRNCGLASTMREHGSHHGANPVPEAGSLTERTALELAAYASSESLPLASIGMASVNSLIDIDLSRCVEKNAFDILRERGQGKRVAVVGHFPFIPKLKEIASELWVLEQHPAEGDLSEEKAETVLPCADVVAITGTSLINHTFEKLVGLCQNSFVVVLGPSTPLSPILFDQGVNVISGVKVTEPESVLRYISEGASFRQIQGVRLLTMVA
ncbi:MAG: hypothetical protein C4532_07790 [Candidatus Abyssobacteria bacterium SURF_17]|uniref:DUF364 domain-containing protein n=1 Tax=Candidatus Abyssobacteria bacterium SURF_17 TaxID=2093361 RepID=A0A419F035_9BACT|nr:MAG: hypothetical protein C4532_07790 [Candidatus Abyssubacteria bacterium SURF_17]